MAIDMQQFHQVFFEESFEGLDMMETGLLNLDTGSADDEEINTIFRAAHSIKGGSGTFGFKNISDFTHLMETLLDEMRDGRRQVSQQAINTLLKSVDCLRMMLTAASDGGDIDNGQVEENYQSLKDILGKADNDDQNVKPSVSHAPDTTSVSKKGSEVPGWHISFKPHENFMQFGNDPVRILRELATLGEVKGQVDTSNVPGFSEFHPEVMYLSWELDLFGNIKKEDIDEVFAWVEDECDITIQPKVVNKENKNKSTEIANKEKPEIELSTPAAVTKTETVKTPAAVNKKEKSASSTVTSSIRVGIDKIDELINMVGELVITQSMLSMLGDDFNMSRLEKLQEGLVQLDRHTRELQESVMQIRMVPISFTFSRFPRMVRDLSNSLGKKIELVMLGENTELDKTVIEKIGDPLVHLVRNSVDHGIEMPEQRVDSGKPETGTIELNAYHRGGNIIIEIKDDGKGINQDIIFNKAVENGLVTADTKLSPQQIFDLLFMPGFSTAAEITDVSGRGVGMDVVKKNIMALGGSIETRSELGQGSTFTIRLPLTLAILDGQSAVVGGEIYIVPLVNIIESIQIGADKVNLVAGKGETFRLRDEYLPIVRLTKIFNIPDSKAQQVDEGLLIVVEAEGRRCGLFVDELQGQQQVVIKSLEQNYRRVDGISGATILGDGSVALILDIPGLIRMVNKH